MAIALIAVRRRNLTYGSVQRLLGTFRVADIAMPNLPWSTDYNLPAFRHIVRELKDGWQFMELLRLLHDRQVANQAAEYDTEYETETESETGCG